MLTWRLMLTWRRAAQLRAAAKCLWRMPCWAACQAPSQPPCPLLLPLVPAERLTARAQAPVLRAAVPRMRRCQTGSCVGHPLWPPPTAATLPLPALATRMQRRAKPRALRWFQRTLLRLMPEMGAAALRCCNCWLVPALYDLHRLMLLPLLYTHA